MTPEDGVVIGTALGTAGSIAVALGRHALPAFVLGLAAVLAGTAVAAWLLRGPLARHARRWRPASGPLIAGVGVGFLAVLGAAALFAVLAEQIGLGGADGPLQSAAPAGGPAPEPGLAQLDELLARSLRAQLPAGAMQFFSLLTHLGDGGVLTLLCVAVALALFATQRWGLAVAWLAALGGNALLTPMLKHIFERVRPLHRPELLPEPSWSFPSGHASSAMVTFGMLAYLALVTRPPRWHLPALLVAAAAVYSVGCSRVLLQVHYASDVLAGWASGAVWLAVCVASAEFSRRRQASR